MGAGVEFVASQDPAIDFERLLQAEADGDEFHVLAFWGDEAQGSHPGPWVLSQWWPASFTIDGVTYTDAEAFLMASKARLFGDEEALAKILQAEHPAEAKNFGRRVVDFDESVWVANRFGLAMKANAAKFAQNPALAMYLSSTRGRVLVEASPRDLIWGVGLSPTSRDLERPSAWRGENLLGFALMAVRDTVLGAPGSHS